MAEDNYMMPKQYRCRELCRHWDDRSETDRWQKYVYAHAHKISLELNLYSVLDIGCGSGYKLLDFFGIGYNICGTELDPCLSFLKKEYPKRKWLKGDWNILVEGYELLICSDVIEHIMDPDEVIGFIKKCNPNVIIISTPVRNNMGPPTNKCHIREWGFKEFHNYLQNRLPEYEWSSTKKKVKRRKATLSTGVKI